MKKKAVVMKSRPNKQQKLFDDSTDQIWSYTRLKSFRRCALEYKVRWIDEKRELSQPQNIDIQAGRLLHRIIREYFQSPLTNEPHKRLLEIYNSHTPITPGWKDDLQGEYRIHRALQLFAASNVSRFKPVGVEVGCKASIRGVWFSGHADLIYKTDDIPSIYGLLEFKLNDVETRSQDEAERFLQEIIYYVGLPKQYYQLIELLSIYIFDTGQLLETKVKQSIVDNALQIVEETIKRANGPDFPPTLNPFCPSCGYQKFCPAYSKSRNMKEQH